MSKKSRLTIILVIGVVLFLIICSIIYKNSSYYITSKHYLSSKEETKTVFSLQNEKNTQDGKSFDFGKFTGKWSLIEFTADKDIIVTIKDSTKISNGIFYIVVLDSDYNIITKKNELNNNADIDFTIPKSGKYIIRIAAKSATGNFNIKVSANNKITLSHIDFFK